MRYVWVFKIVGQSRTTSQITKCFIQKAVTELIVTSVQLSVSFFKNQDPKLIVEILGKDRRAVRITRKQVIDGDHLPFAIFTDFYPIDPQIINMSRKE